MVKKTQLPRHIIDAALDLAAEKGWAAISLADVAARARLPLTEVYEHFRSKAAILDGFYDVLDHAVLVGDIESEGATRDRLFDVVMRRLDAMSPYKSAVRAILKEGAGDPLSALCGARRFLRSMALMLETAGISTSGLTGIARVEGVAAIYLYTLRVWLRDDTADMAPTMAALDKSLRRAESLAGLLHRRGSRRTEPPAGPTPEPPAAAAT